MTLQELLQGKGYSNIIKSRAGYIPTNPVNVNNNISMGYRPNLDFRMGGTRSGLFPPSRSMIGGQGFSKSPFLEDVSNVSESIYNEALVPTYNTISKKIDPIFMGIKSYLGGDSSPVMGTIEKKDFNLTNKKTTTDQPQTLTEEIQADIDKAQEDKNQVPDVSLQSQANQDGLLSNNEVKEQNNKGILSFTSQPAKEGGYTYSKPVSKKGLLESEGTNVETAETKTEVNAVSNTPVVADPSVEAVATPNNTEVTPTKTFMDKLTNFATSEFGQDFFASLLAQSGPTVGKPQSFGSNLGQAYQKARELQAERDKKTDGSDALMKGLVSGNGNTAPLFADKGGVYALFNGQKIPEKNFKDVFGKNFSYETMGQQKFGLLNASDMNDLSVRLDKSEEEVISLINYIDDVGSASVGVSRIADGFLGTAKKLFGKDLSEEEFRLKLLDASLPGVVASLRLEASGPGVLTDQDFINILNTLGGPADIYQNPDIVQQRISEYIAKKYKAYETELNIYNGNVDNQYGSLGYEKKAPLKLSDRQIKLLSPDVQVRLGKFDPNRYEIPELLSMAKDPRVRIETREAIVEFLEGLD